MTEKIGHDEVGRMISAAVSGIREHHELLSKLDSAIGDGDHGTTMLRAAEAMAKSVEEDESGKLESLLHAVGWSIMCTDGGSTGPLFGSFFMGLSEGVGDSESLDSAGLAEMFEAGLAKVQKQSKARVGDKTMMDALMPAVDALREAADAGLGVDEAMGLAVEAATRGAEATTDMQAKFGRAKEPG